jgi:choline-sulfatase
MIRTPQYKFVKRYPHGPYDLFELEDDPGETLNRAGWLHLAEVQDQLEAQLEAWYAGHEDPEKSGLRVKELRRHNGQAEAWRDGLRERRGLQVY